MVLTNQQHESFCEAINMLLVISILHHYKYTKEIGDNFGRKKKELRQAPLSFLIFNYKNKYPKLINNLLFGNQIDVKLVCRFCDNWL